jgi:hypothetical protein
MLCNKVIRVESKEPVDNHHEFAELSQMDLLLGHSGVGRD